MSLPSSLGLQFDSKFMLENGMTFAPYLRAAWVHDFMPDRHITASFNVAPGFLFSTIGTPALADSAQIVIGSELAIDRRVSLFSSLATQVASHLAFVLSGFAESYDRINSLPSADSCRLGRHPRMIACIWRAWRDAANESRFSAGAWLALRAPS